MGTEKITLERSITCFSPQCHKLSSLTGPKRGIPPIWNIWHKAKNYKVLLKLQRGGRNLSCCAPPLGKTKVSLQQSTATAYKRKRKSPQSPQNIPKLQEEFMRNPFMKVFRVREDKTFPPLQRMENTSRQQGGSCMFPRRSPTSVPSSHSDTCALLETHEDVPSHPGIFRKHLEEFLVVCAERSDKYIILDLIQQNFWSSLAAWEDVLQMTEVPNS